MKLDSRIIEGKKPLDCFDSEYAKQFIGKKGFVTDELNKFRDLNKIQESTLKNVWPNETYCFVASVTSYKYFLPAEWVKEKEPEPEWKPYDLDTLREDKIHFGKAITFRRKTEDNSARIITAIYNGKSENSDNLNDSEILLGCEWFGFQRLFEDYEIFDNVYGGSNVYKWRPFGYQE